MLVEEIYRQICTCCGLEMTRGIVALGDEDIVGHAALQWLIQWYWGTHEFLFYLA